MLQILSKKDGYFNGNQKHFKKKKNPDLWIRFLKIYRKHNVRFVWIKGHSNITENEICDRLAVNAYSNGNLIEDEGYLPDNEEQYFNMKSQLLHKISLQLYKIMMHFCKKVC